MRPLSLVVLLLIAAPLHAQHGAAQRTSLVDAEAHVYKTIGDTELRLHVFRSEQAVEGPRPAIVFFFGGGWVGGTVSQFVPHAKYLATRGMVGIVADYRVRSRHGITPFECVSDAKSAIRWLRLHATEIGVDPQRIVAAGGSAGGHLAACTALVSGLEETGEDAGVSSEPAALVLFNPVLDLPSMVARAGESRAVARFGEWVRRSREISPVHHVGSTAPPTIIFHGTADTTVPFGQATRFRDAMIERKHRCELVEFEGRDHGFFNRGRGDGADFLATVRKMDEFLASLGYLRGAPTIDASAR